MVGGGTPSKQEPRYWNGPIPWVSPKDMKSRIISDSIDSISEAAVDESSVSLVPPQSILIVVRSGILARTVPISITSKSVAINQDIKALIADGSLIPHYLQRFLEARQEWLRRRVTRSATVHRLSTDVLRELLIPMQTLADQRRIVAKLDQAFAEIDRAIENTERAMGRLAEFEHQIVEKATDDKNWPTSTIGDQIQLQRGFDITKKEQRPGNVPVVSSGGIKSFHDEARVIAPGVVVGRKGSIGSVHFIEDDFWPHDTTLWVKDFKGNEPRFVYHFLRGLDLKGLDSGAANPALNRNLIHPVVVKWPSVEEQQSIVQRIESASILVDRAKAANQRKLTALRALKQSILAETFSFPEEASA